MPNGVALHGCGGQGLKLAAGQIKIRLFPLSPSITLARSE